MASLEPLEPIAQVKSVESLKATVEAINQALQRAGELGAESVDQYRWAGQQLINTKAKLERGSFNSWVNENCNCSHREAQRYMRLAREWQKLQDAGEPIMSLRQAMKYLVEPAQEEVATVSLFCDRCQRTGPVRDCKACADLRKATPARAPEREPGDDTEAEKESAARRNDSGKLVLNWREFNSEFGYLVRSVDRVGRAFGTKEDKLANELRDRLAKWKEDFRAWYQASAKGAK